METFLLTVLILMAAGGILLLALAHKALRDLNKELTQTIATLVSLEAKVSAQQSQIDEIRRSLIDEKSNPLSQVGTIVSQFQKKGLVPGLIALGSALFRTYFKNKHGKALPIPVKKKD